MLGLLVQIAASVLKGISGNKHTAHFVLYDQRRRDHLLHSIINRLPTDMQRQFIIDEYADKFRVTYPYIRRSVSGESTDSSTTTTRHNHVHSSLFDTMGWCLLCGVRSYCTAHNLTLLLWSVE